MSRQLRNFPNCLSSWGNFQFLTTEGFTKFTKRGFYTHTPKKWSGKKVDKVLTKKRMYCILTTKKNKLSHSCKKVAKKCCRVLSKIKKGFVTLCHLFPRVCHALFEWPLIFFSCTAYSLSSNGECSLYDDGPESYLDTFAGENRTTNIFVKEGNIVCKYSS